MHRGDMLIFLGGKLVRSAISFLFSLLRVGAPTAVIKSFHSRDLSPDARCSFEGRSHDMSTSTPRYLIPLRVM